MLNVKIDQSAEEIGLASMLADLMQQNVEHHPKRKADFDALKGSIAIEAKDAEVSLTLDFLGGELVVYGGVRGKPDIMISTDSSTILDLNNAKLMFGLPDLMDATGRAVIKKMLSGELKIRGSGLLLKPMLLIRLTKLLSVHEEPGVNLLAGETICYRANLHWLVFFLPALLTIGAICALFAEKNFLPEAVVLFIIAAILWISNLIKYTASEFFVTDKRVLVKTGLVGKRSIRILFSEIDGIDVSQRISGRILGYGKITLRGKGGAKESFCCIARPLEFSNKIREQTAKTQQLQQ